MSKKLVYAIILISSFCTLSNAQQRGYLGSSAGFDVSIVLPQDVHPTPGWGGVMDFGFGLGPAGQLHMHPNLEFWVSGNGNAYDQNLHLSFDYTVFETSFNGDVRYYPPVPSSSPVKPFVGNGLAILMTYDHGNYNRHGEYDWSHYDVGAGFDFLGGIDFKMSTNTIGYAEVKGKFGHYDLAKFTFGMQFLIY